MNRHTTDHTDPQMMLATAWANRNILDFQNALRIGGNPLAIDDKHLSIYEHALQSPGAADFVYECLKAGCDPNHINNFYNKAAINFATDSHDPIIIKTLLSSPGVRVNHGYESFTPLRSLIKQVTTDNFDDIFQCVKTILEYETCINKSDHIEMLPLCDVVENLNLRPDQKSEFVEEFLKVPNINIDSFEEGKLRRLLEDEYPSIRLPAKCQTTRITFYTLLNHIKEHKMDMFIQQYNDETCYTTEKGDLELLRESVALEVHEAFDVLFTRGVDYNKKFNYTENNSGIKGYNSLLEIACIYGNAYALQRILKLPEFYTKDNILFIIVNKLSQEYSKFDKMWNCFYVLLDSDKIDINATDYSKSTVLHYAVKSHNNRAVRELLKRGAAVCITNWHHELPLNGISPQLLEAHLDDCISSTGDKYAGKDYEIVIDLKNFTHSTQSSKKQLNEVLTSFEFMSKSKELRNLIQHPVITSILHLKWQKLSLVFYINFFLCLFFTLSVVTFSICKFRAIENEYEVIKNVARYCSWLGLCYLMIRELLQFILSPLSHLQKPTNCVEILLIVCALATCCGDIFKIPPNWHRNISVTCILLLAYELLLLVGALPISSMSTHMLMLKAVCKSFLKIFMLYSIFIVTFTLCFYIKGEKLSGTEAEYSEEAFQRFSNPLSSFIKTIVMFTGEFDASNLQLDSNYLLFLVFVFLMTIILFNLLNGLAVSDTQAIKSHAELHELTSCIKVLSRYEKSVFKNRDYSRYSAKCNPVQFARYVLQKLFVYTTDSKISIRPNDKYRILISQTKIKPNKNRLQISEKVNENETLITILDEAYHSDEENISSNCLLECYYSLIPKISSGSLEKIVELAMAVLEKKSFPIDESRLERKLDKVLEALKLYESQESQYF